MLQELLEKRVTGAGRYEQLDWNHLFVTAPGIQLKDSSLCRNPVRKRGEQRFYQGAVHHDFVRSVYNNVVYGTTNEPGARTGPVQIGEMHRERPGESSFNSLMYLMVRPGPQNQFYRLEYGESIHRIRRAVETRRVMEV